MMPYAADDRGCPVFFISSMAMHTQNLLQDPRASLLVTQPDVSGDPLGAARVTLVGTAAEVSAAEVRELLPLAARECEALAGFHRLRVLPAGGYGRVLRRRLRRDGVDRRRGLWKRPPRPVDGCPPRESSST